MNDTASYGRPSTAIRAAGLLQAASSTMLERDGKYRGADDLYAKLMAVLFPDLRLRTLEDHHRFHLLMLLIVKLTRYIRSWDGGHDDSLIDLVNYGAMLLAVDQAARAAREMEAK